MKRFRLEPDKRIFCNNFFEKERTKEEIIEYLDLESKYLHLKEELAKWMVKKSEKLTKGQKVSSDIIRLSAYIEKLGKKIDRLNDLNNP